MQCKRSDNGYSVVWSFLLTAPVVESVVIVCVGLWGFHLFIIFKGFLPPMCLVLGAT